MSNFRKVSNYTIAGLLAVGVLLLSFFAYRAKIQADTIVPGYATAHLNIQVTVPTIQAVPFRVTFTPLAANAKRYYFKERSFDLSAAGLNTIEWYIRKIPAGSYKLTLTSNQQELTGSPYEVSLENDVVGDTASFTLNLGEPASSSILAPAITPTPTPASASTTPADQNLPDPGYDQDQTTGDETALPTTSSTASNDSPPVPGASSTASGDTYGPF